MTHALIIDDDNKNVAVLAQLLALEGVDCTKVPNPNQLPAALQSLDEVDVVFLDLEMPIDGFQVLDQLRGDARFKGIPIVAYTVHLSEINVVYEYGFDGFLGKPLNATKFPNQLNRILSGEAVWETS